MRDFHRLHLARKPGPQVGACAWRFLAGTAVGFVCRPGQASQASFRPLAQIGHALPLQDVSFRQATGRPGCTL